MNPGSAIQNLNPKIYRSKEPAKIASCSLEFDNDEEREDWTSDDVFDLIRGINDPEHPLTLEQLHVVQLEHITVDDLGSSIAIDFTPTIPHCSMATLIGLTLKVRLLRSLPERFKVDVSIRPGTHQSEQSINKQLNDKERVAAALENNSLLNVVNQCLAFTRERESLYI